MQKHAARSLHWDFRLEWAGTLRSWAVPKGPSLDPHDKRLAVEVEDHPIAYATFEGDIPKGQYGGGHVDIWDSGTWQPVADFNQGLKKGHLEFEMFGRKLRGRWHLVRTRMQGKQPNWLLMKSDDEFARAGADAAVIDAGGSGPAGGPLPKANAAAKSPLKPKRGGAPKPRSAKSKGTRGGALPASIKPTLATLVDKVPAEKGWVFELKYDGVRLLRAATETRFVAFRAMASTGRTRSGRSSKHWPGMKLDGAWVDGELIVSDPNGRSDFSLLQHTIGEDDQVGMAPVHQLDGCRPAVRLGDLARLEGPLQKLADHLAPLPSVSRRRRRARPPRFRTVRPGPRAFARPSGHPNCWTRDRGREQRPVSRAVSRRHPLR